MAKMSFDERGQAVGMLEARRSISKVCVYVLVCVLYPYQYKCTMLFNSSIVIFTWIPIQIRKIGIVAL